MFLGLRTAIYPAPDLDRAKEWYKKALGIEPYFDEPYYVGFEVGGYELGLNPDVRNHEPGTAGTAGGVAYWGVEDAAAAYAHLLAAGAAPHSPVADVGGGIQVATVLDPFGNVFGLIENPNFRRT
jgi:predicted enzyme related to lactoylglutathione lyase